MATGNFIFFKIFFHLFRLEIQSPFRYTLSHSNNPFTGDFMTFPKVCATALLGALALGACSQEKPGYASITSTTPADIAALAAELRRMGLLPD